MTLPRHPEKLDELALVTPDASVAYHYDEPPPAPDAVILCYHDGLYEHAAAAYHTTPFPGFGRGLAFDETGGRVGIMRVPGVGAPAAALAMEELIARGTGAVVTLGHVGALDPALAVGDLVVVDRALRDEGTSHHYLESADFIQADGELRTVLDESLDAAGETYRVGPTWTTDAPHRETRAEVERYRSEGVLTVDMEAAGVFGVAEFRGVQAGAAFTISDVLDTDGWEPAFDETGPHLKRLLERVVDALSGDVDTGD